jgi:hypothetical protein
VPFLSKGQWYINKYHIRLYQNQEIYMLWVIANIWLNVESSLLNPELSIISSSCSGMAQGIYIKRAVFMLFSSFQHLSRFVIRICVALLINCTICFVLHCSTNVPNINRGLRGRDRMVAWFIITCAISDYLHYRMIHK